MPCLKTSSKPSTIKTKPINIPNNNNNNNDEYSLKLNIFDPNKCSPPSSWNKRLIVRINNYDNINSQFH